MKFLLGLPMTHDFQPEAENWLAMREPEIKVAMAIGHFSSVLCGGLAYLVTASLFDFSFEAFFVEYDVLILPIVLVLILAHELFHLAMHPGWGLTSRSQCGFLPQWVLFYAHYDGPTSRNRGLIILIAPFIGLSLLPMLLAAVYPSAALLASFIAIMNTTFSTLDLFNCLVMLRGIPSKAVIRNKGWQTYWKRPEEIGSNRMLDVTS